MSSYTKSDLVAELARDLGVSRRKVNHLLDQLAAVAYREARAGGFTVPGICRIDVVRRKERRARNPRTGETLLIAEHDMVRVRHLKRVRDMVTPPPPDLVTVLPPEREAVPDVPPSQEEPAVPAWQPLLEDAAPVPAAAPAPVPPPQPAPALEKLISFRCKNPDCRQEIEAYDDMAGSSSECPSCGSPIEVPYFSEPGTLHGPALPAEGGGDSTMGRTIRIELPDDDLFA